jgi:hypothetical protein
MDLWGDNKVKSEVDEVSDSRATIKSIAQSLYENSDQHEHLELFIEESGILGSNSNNSYLKNPIKGMEFIAQLFSKSRKKSDNLENSLEKLDLYLKHNFISFLNTIEIENSANIYQKLIDIRDEIAEDIKFKELIGKRVVGFGGSFSAGKSSFVNAILETEDDILPVETRPTTSIPTYIVKNRSDGIYTFNRDGEKSEIDREGLLAISHEFNEVYGFGLISLIKKIIIDSRKMPYENIAFLDTPGYSKSDGDENIDRDIARNHLKNLDALIWLIDIDNGTLRHSDLEFIKSLKLPKDVEILFVFNKADKKPRSEIGNIVFEAGKLLEKSGIVNPYDITAYSSHDRKEFVVTRANQNSSIKVKQKTERIPSFLNRQNRPQSKLFYSRVEEILENLQTILEDKERSAKSVLGVFNAIDIYSSNLDIPKKDEFEKIAKGSLKKVKDDLSQFSTVKRELLQTLNSFKGKDDDIFSRKIKEKKEAEKRAREKEYQRKLTQDRQRMEQIRERKSAQEEQKIEQEVKRRLAKERKIAKEKRERKKEENRRKKEERELDKEEKKRTRMGRSTRRKKRIGTKIGKRMGKNKIEGDRF